MYRQFLEEVYAVQDDASHWYIIPLEMQIEFDRLMEAGYKTDFEDTDEFEEKFARYRTGGDLNNIQLYADMSKHIKFED